MDPGSLIWVIPAYTTSWDSTTAYQEAGELGEVLHSVQVDFYYAEAVYAPVYYGYGGPDTFADRDRRAREWDEELMTLAPETLLAHLTATPEEIRGRMAEAPHPGAMLRSEDVERVLERFAEQYDRSLIRQKIALDTTHATPEQTLSGFRSLVAQHLSPSDRQGIDEGRSAG